jgi:hypothetical protein
MEGGRRAETTCLPCPPTSRWQFAGRAIFYLFAGTAGFAFPPLNNDN